MKFPSLFLRYGVHKVFGLLPAVTLLSDVLIPKFNQHIDEPKYICGQNWARFPSMVFETCCSQGFPYTQDSQTHSQTDTLENRMPPALKVLGSRGLTTFQKEPTISKICNSYSAFHTTSAETNTIVYTLRVPIKHITTCTRTADYFLNICIQVSYILSNTMHPFILYSLWQ